MPTANARLSADELHMVGALAAGRTVHLSSAHRLRLEMLGLLKDGPNGPKLTELGRAHARAALAAKPSEGEQQPQRSAGKRDRLNRRLPHTRTLPFP